MCTMVAAAMAGLATSAFQHPLRSAVIVVWLVAAELF